MKAKIWIALIIVVVVGGMIFFNLTKSTETGGGGLKSGKTTLVKAITIGKEDLSSSVTVSGVVKEALKTEVYMETTLKAIDVPIKANMTVKKGDILIVVDTSPLESELQRLTLQKEMQQITLNKLESDLSLTGLTTQIKSAEAALANARKNLVDAKETYAEQKTDFDLGLITQQQLDNYDRAIDDAQTAVDNATLSLGNANESLNSSKSSQVMDVKSQLKNLELLELQINDARNHLEKAKQSVIAPIDGVVTTVNAVKGGMVSTQQPMFVIMDLSKLEIKAAVNEYNIPNIKTGQKVKLTGEAFPNDTVIMATVTDIAPIAYLARTTSGEETVIDVILVPDIHDALLKPGLNLDCEILTEEKIGALSADLEVFREDKNGEQYVMAIDESGDTPMIVTKYVKLGIYSGLKAEIVEGLTEGEKVVLDPQPSLSDGDYVKIEE